MRHLSQRFYYGWIVLAAVSGLNFANSATSIGVLTVFILPLTAEFGWTRTQISAVTSVGAVLGVLIAPVAGRLTDRVGARLPLTIASGGIVLATLALAAMQSLLGFYVAFGLARLADQGLVQACSPPAVAKWFQRYRGRAMAVLFFVSSAGGVIVPLLVHLVIHTWHWRIAWVMLSGMMCLLGLVPCAFLVRRQPEDVGFCINGTSPPVPTTQTVPPSGSVSSPAPASAPDAWLLSEALTTPTLWLLLAAALMVGTGTTGVARHLVPYLRQQGIAPTAAVGTVSIGFLVSGLGNLLWGFGADKLAARPLLLITYALHAASLVVLLATNTALTASLYAVLQGGAAGGMGTLTAVLLADYYGRRDLGAIYGLLRAGQVTGFALGPLIAGATFDLTQSYLMAFVAFLALSLTGMGFVTLATPPQKYGTVAE